MSAGVVSPVVPYLAPGRAEARWAAPPRPPLPELSRARDRATVYGLATLDDRGRVADRALIRSLGWVGGTRLDICEVRGLVLVRADLCGVFAVTGLGHVRLPAVVRHRCDLAGGDRVLLAADRAQGRLVVHPR
ncbi:hypothetical protein Prum_067310 [Phytohabitans rumicis]|uniref:Uncharacterized protein n=1 Tax=Phytohabitans rumicis TaxID=1076125 RepID=A0A6V8LEQ7_9ACTN|nr:hypothetical protein Prum_067310 [Phytohabitans rumicis]